MPFNVHPRLATRSAGCSRATCRAIGIHAKVIGSPRRGPRVPRTRACSRITNSTVPRACPPIRARLWITSPPAPPRPNRRFSPPAGNLVHVVQRGRLTVVPPIDTGFQRRPGVSFPVRPTCTRMSSIWVSPARAGKLVGDRPARGLTCKAQLILQPMRSTLTTTPSIS